VILSAKEAARELGIDARTFRKFMREILDVEDQPGQGNRYHIDSKDIKKLKKKFEKWQRPKSKASPSNPIVIPDDEEDDDPHQTMIENALDFGDDPSDEELMDIELEQP
jgi:hypothetical protein